MTEKMAYRICIKNPPGLVDVEGEPIGDGQFAVRMVMYGLWSVDHIDTGFRCAGGSTKRNALKNYRAILKEKSAEDFEKAIRKAHRIIKKHNL